MRAPSLEQVPVSQPAEVCVALDAQPVEAPAALMQARPRGGYSAAACAAADVQLAEDFAAWARVPAPTQDDYSAAPRVVVRCAQAAPQAA